MTDKSKKQQPHTPSPMLKLINSEHSSQEDPR